MALYIGHRTFSDEFWNFAHFLERGYLEINFGHSEYRINQLFQLLHYFE